MDREERNRVESQFEEMEDKYEVMKEFMIEKLSQYGAKIAEIEKKQNQDVTDIKDIKEELSSLSGKSMTESITETEASQPLKTSTSLFKRKADTSPTEKRPHLETRPGFPKFPKFLDEVRDQEWRERIRERYTTITTLDKKEKLSKAQLAFFHYWFHRNAPLTGRREEAQKVLAEGQRAGFWPRDWAPEGILDFLSYLTDKIKNYNRKLRRQELKTVLNRKLRRQELKTVLYNDLEEMNQSPC